MKKYLLSLFAMLAVVFSASADDITDVLNNAWTGVSGTSYSAVTDLEGSASDAVYSVQCAGGNSAIQLRSNNNNSGIVTTTSGGDAKTLKVTWNENTNAARVIQVYGSATAYSSPSDLYDASKQGTLIGELGTSDTELDLKDYAYIGIRSKSGALYLDKVEITWSTGGPSISKPTLTASTSFVDEMEVTITNTNESGTVYYTTDGGDPTEEDAIYTGAFTITETTTVKAVVVTEAGSSPIASATYTKIAKSTIAEVLAGDAGETYYTEGTVIAAGAGGFIVADAEDYIYVYYSAGDNNFRVGNQVKIIGATTEYKGTKQFTNAAQITEVGNIDVNYPVTHTLFSTEFEAAQSAGAIEHGYYDFTGKLTISGNYFNIAIEGTDAAMGALIKPFDDLSELDGKVVEVTGYGLYVNSKYVYFIATNVEEYVEKFSVTMADGVEGGTLEFEPETAAAGTTVTVTVIPDDGKVFESITANCVNINQAVELTPGTTENVYTLEMPADDVIVIPVFADIPTYGFTLTTSGEGEAAVDPATAKAGETMTITATPAAGNKVEFVTVRGTNTNVAVEVNPGETEGTYVFTMPADDVHISVSFIAEGFTPVDIDVAAYQGTWVSDLGNVGIYNSHKEQYNGSTAEGLGKVLYQTITGLEDGTYTVTIEANASSTGSRDNIAGKITENGDLGRVQIYANGVEKTIPTLIQTAVSTNNVVTLENVVVEGGSLELGMRKDIGGTNWHTIQITALRYESNEAQPDAEAAVAYWQGVRDDVLALPAYSNVAGVERSAVSAAEDEATLVAALPAFYSAKEAYNAALEAIAAAKEAGVNTSAAEEEMASDEMTAERALELAAELNTAARDIKYADASEENPMVTDFVVNPSFNDGISPWQSTTRAQNQALANNQSGFPNQPFYENWNPSNYTGKMYQVIDNIPNGIYELKMWAFVNTFDGTHQYVYANGDKTYLTQGPPAEYTVRTIVVDRKIEIGLMQDAAVNGWMGLDDAVLTYYGPVDFKVALADAITAADAINADAKMNVDVKDAFDSAYANAVSVYANDNATEDDVIAATSALQSATSAATSSIAAYAAAADNFEAFKAEVQSTNVVSAEAKTAMEAFLSAYEDCTLTDTEVAVIVNPTDATGWRQNPTQIGEYILSAWDEEPYNWGSYHPNTWSVEGNNDGSNFRVPFIEYWTGDDASLAEKTLTATVTDLTPGIYEVTAWTRVRIKNGAAAPATGITFQVGEGEAVDVTTGEIIGAGPFYIGEFTATGVVGEDSVLTIKYNVAADNNISWLAFKNVNYTRIPGYNIYLPDLAGAIITTDPFGDAYEGSKVTITVETEEGFDIDAVQVLDATGAPVAEVEVAETIGMYTFTMPATDVYIDVTLIETDPNDYTYLIQNPAYLHKGDAGTADYAGWTWSPAPGESGWKYRDYAEPMNLVTYSGNVNFSFEQTIPEVPAGIYRLSVYGFYRAGSAQDEANRVGEGDVTHNLNMFAEVGDAIFTQPIMNLYEGAADVDVTGKNNHSIVPGYEDFFVPDGAVDSREFYIAGYYRNDLEITVPEDGEVMIGINHPTGMTYDGDYAPIGAWELYKVGEYVPVVPGTELTVEREPGLGYGATRARIDLTDAMEYLGVNYFTNEMLQIVNPDGSYVADYATYDGWFNVNGRAETWSSLNSTDPKTPGICVKLFQALENGQFEICDMNGADAIDDTTGEYPAYTVNWVLVANEKEWPIAITVQFAEPKPVEVEIADIISVDHNEVEKTPYSESTEEVDVAYVCEVLGIDNIDEAEYKAAFWNQDEEKYTFESVTTDGWRDPETGAQNGWGNAGGICTKVWGTGGALGTGNITYIGCFDDSHVAGEFYTFYWAFIANDKAVIYAVNINFVEKEVPALTYDDLNIIAEQGIEFNYDLGTSYQEDVATVDVAAIKAAFGTPAEPTLTIYAVLSNNTLDPSYGLGTSDGWRNADGDWESWGGESVFCVKADFTAESDQIYYVGTKMAASQEEDEPGTYVARYVFVNEDGSEKPDAVLFTVTINYGDAVGINGILADKTGEQKIFDLSGRRIETITKGGMYIINGKKVFVK
ncbi:MAG: chitobiase/beta-hexosaminidase C-terminal domain-containing protein [Bacteroidales bacterium]|nr:chitobiase/beta-hexosaminidase C-terminal domain-containing protein [Bacteroidales bacterium]